MKSIITSLFFEQGENFTFFQKGDMKLTEDTLKFLIQSKSKGLISKSLEYFHPEFLSYDLKKAMKSFGMKKKLESEVGDVFSISRLDDSKKRQIKQWLSELKPTKEEQKMLDKFEVKVKHK